MICAEKIVAYTFFICQTAFIEYVGSYGAHHKAQHSKTPMCRLTAKAVTSSMKWLIFLKTLLAS
jgi:hypothetical protein